MPILPRILAAVCSPAGREALQHRSLYPRAIVTFLPALLFAACRSTPPVPQPPAPVDTVITPPQPLLSPPATLQPDSTWYITHSLTITRESGAELVDSARYQERIHAVLHNATASRWVLTLQSDSGHRRVLPMQNSTDSLIAPTSDTTSLSLRVLLDVEQGASIPLEPSRTCISARSLLSPLITAILTRHLLQIPRNTPELLRYVTCYLELSTVTSVQLSPTDEQSSNNGILQSRTRVSLSADSSKFLPMNLSGSFTGAVQSFGRRYQLPDSMKIITTGELLFRSSAREQRIQQSVETTLRRQSSRF